MIDARASLQEHESELVPALRLEPGALSLKARTVHKPRVAEMAWQPFDCAACRRRGDTASLEALVSGAQMEAARRLAADWGVGEATVEVRAVLAETRPHAPAGHCLLTKQFDVTDVFASVAAAVDSALDATAGAREAEATGGNVLLTARVRQSGSIVVKAWAQEDVSQFYATRTATETKRVIGARAVSVRFSLTSAITLQLIQLTQSLLQNTARLLSAAPLCKSCKLQSCWLPHARYIATCLQRRRLTRWAAQTAGLRAATARSTTSRASLEYPKSARPTWLRNRAQPLIAEAILNARPAMLIAIPGCSAMRTHFRLRLQCLLSLERWRRARAIRQCPDSLQIHGLEPGGFGRVDEGRLLGQHR